MKINLIFAITILISGSCFSQITDIEQYYVSYPNEIGVIESCSKGSNDFILNLKTNSKEPIEIFSFKLEKYEFEIYSNDMLISKSDTLRISLNNPNILKLKFLNTDILRPKIFSFKTSNKEDSNCEVNINYGEYYLESRNFKDGLDQEIKISESCSDSIKIVFPYGGTISDVYISNDSLTTNKPIKRFSYYHGGENNFVVFSKNEIGTYYVRFGSCHWGSQFWLHLK